MYAYPVFSTECLPELASIIYSSVFKGLGHEMGYFLSSERSNLYILYMRRWFSGCIFGKKNKYKGFACFYEKTTNFKNFNADNEPFHMGKILMLNQKSRL